MLWHVIIISIRELRLRTENVNILVEKLKNLNIAYTVINAVYWKSHNIDEVLKTHNIICTGGISDKKKGQICCYISHRLAWAEIAKATGDTRYIVLEDDVDLTEDFNSDNLTSLIATLPSYDYVGLWKFPAQAGNQIKHPYNQYFSRYYFNWTTAGYLMSSDFASELLQNKNYSEPVDDFLGHQYLLKKQKNTSFIIIKEPIINLGHFAPVGRINIHTSISY